MFLLDDILLAPLHGVIWMGRKFNEVIQHEENDEGKMKENLLELQTKLMMDEISEEEYRRQETALLERLEAIQEEKEGG
ncbi:MAG: gas vesicle protein GvpG [Actinobacteria bacterium]|nr:gas vesicle protein GvpG [Actinomycetota bacterium]MCG2679382.1 gas vesicle protein GvpG [Kiritimatiellia bacterium]